MAFLFSLFEYKPSPFCVFDEVDATLDEANIKRFLNFLHKLKEKTQFLIITHNFKTMEEADYIYGISMNEPGISTIYSMKMTDKGYISNWSERHIAYAARLGTFSLSDGFITERGIAHRCGSVVTNLEIPPSPRTAVGPYANCLFYANEKCGLCIERCPAKAITEYGHDKVRCREYLHELGYNPELLKNGYDLEKSVAGCGLCQTNVSCVAINPTRKLKKL